MKTPPLPPEILQFFRDAGARGGKIGGKIGAAIVNGKLSPGERSEKARKAVAAREAKRAAAKKKAKRSPKTAARKARVKRT